MNQDYVNPNLTDLLADIAHSLRIIAKWAEYQHIQATNEKTYEIGGFVRSRNNGGDLVYLYATHPGLQYRVATVYEERWNELPFDPSGAPVYDGEQAPSKDYAISKGFLIETTPFRIAMLPTGKQTESGHPIYKLSRVLDADIDNPVPDRQSLPLKSQQNNIPKPSNLPSAVSQTSAIADIAKASAQNVMMDVDCTNVDIKTRPLTPQALVCALRRKATHLDQKGVMPLSKGENGSNQYLAIRSQLTRITGNETNYRTFISLLFGVNSLGACTPGQQQAIRVWIGLRKDEHGNWGPDPVSEYELREFVTAYIQPEFSF